MRAIPIALLAACSGSAPPPAELGPTVARFEAPADRAAEPPEFSGIVTARRTRVVSAEFAGRLDRVPISAGQRVRAGEPLATLDGTQLKAQILTAESEEDAALARARSAGSRAYTAAQSARRAGWLVASGTWSVATQQKEQGDAASASADRSAELARARGARAEVERLQALVAKADVVSPFDGIVTVVHVKEGETAAQGAAIARVADPRDLIMKFSVPKEHRGRIARGKRVELQIDGVDHPVWATVERIADEPPPINFAVVEADIDDAKLRPDEVRVAAQGRVRIADASEGETR